MTTIKLEYAVEVDGIKLEQVNMRRPKVRDMLMGEKVATTAAEKEVVVFANLCDIEPCLIEEMDAKDYQKLQTVYQGFFD